MRATQYLLATLKEIPKNCEIISHQLMLRSGMIRQVSSGLYIWLPTGLRILKKIENIIREEMNKIGFIEIFMPITQPATLWKQSGRWSEYGPELLRFKNRTNQEFILGPTHEEVISDLICKEMISIKQLPLKIYQINTKYRDEARPRFGIIRSKEFIMKDGYSFHINQKSLQNTYDNMYQQYHIIFNRIGLKFKVVQADPGNIGGILSHEFQAYFDIKKNNHNTESIILQNNPSCNFNKKNDNIVTFSKIKNQCSKKIMKLSESSSDKSVSQLSNQLNLPIYKTIKIIIVQTCSNQKNNSYNFLGLIIRGDHQLSYSKLLMIKEIAYPISILNIKNIQKIIGIKPTLLNLIKLSIPLMADYNVATMNNFIIESNTHGKYLSQVNWNEDLPIPKVADLCKSTCNNYNKKKIITNNTSSVCNNIEIGHLFQLGKKYCNSIYSCIQKYNKYNLTMTMGCYGIGITRMIPVIIEQHYYNNNEIIWPDEIAPFRLAIIPINMHHSITVKKITEELYIQLLSILKIDVFIDDRKESPGIMFTDIDLIGIPHVLIISDRNLNNKEIEYKNRKTGITKKIKLDSILQFLNKKFSV